MAFEAGRDGLWLARWLRARGIEAYVIHATSIAVSPEHWRAKTDRLDTEERRHARAVAERFLGVDFSPAQYLVDEASAIAFRELVTLAKALGVETFDRIFEAVFDLDLGDEFSVAAGAPDLFIWRPTLTPAV